MKPVMVFYAHALVQAGYLVLAVEQCGFGERKSTKWREAPRSCRHQALIDLMAGRTIIGERVWNRMCAIDFLTQRADIVEDTLGCVGNSGGGTTTPWLFALDERITVSVPSCFFCSFFAAIGSISHCECNSVPGILAWAEMGDLAALVAPRPLRAVNGQRDPIFLIDAARERFDALQHTYDVLSAAGDHLILGVADNVPPDANLHGLEAIKQRTEELGPVQPTDYGKRFVGIN